MDEPKYTSDDAADIFWGEHEDFEPEPVATIDQGSGRWQSYEMRIMKAKDGQHWAVKGALALTEMQENSFDSAPFMVEPAEVVVPATIATVWFKGDEQIR